MLIVYILYLFQICTCINFQSRKAGNELENRELIITFRLYQKFESIKTNGNKWKTKSF